MAYNSSHTQRSGSSKFTSPGQPGDRAGRVGRRSARVLLSALVALSVFASLLPALADADHDEYCYAVANPAKDVTLLVQIDKLDFDPATNETVIGSGNTTTEKTDSIAFDANSGVLFGTNVFMGERPENERDGYIGTYNLNTAVFSARPNSVGYGSGIHGEQNLYDMSGLAFDLQTGYLYATHVRTTGGQADLLYRVNPTTGSLVENAFGQGIDYVSMPFLPNHTDLQTVDDIAIDPANGQMYGVINNSATGDRLIKINKLTGATTDVGPLGIGEVEGMDFDPYGKLWVTAAVEDNSTEWYLYEVNKNTGAASNPRRIDNSNNYEALACMIGPYVGNATPTATTTGTNPPTSTFTNTPTNTATRTATPTNTQPPDVPTDTPEGPDKPYRLYVPLVGGG